MKICILGGGTAGWLAALILTKERPDNEYTLIESEKIGPIGVGEGSTGLFSDLIKSGYYGISTEEFITRTDALPKLGIRFTNWKGDGTWFDSPLGGSYTARPDLGLDLFTYACILNNIPVEYACDASTLTKSNLTNFFVKDDKVVEYDPTMSSFHFDANKLGEFLRLKVKKHLFKYYNGEVCDVKLEENKVKSLTLSDGTVIKSDIFIDASGLSRVLSNKLKQEVIYYTDVLPCDSSFLFKPENNNIPKIPNTQAHARNNGWIFEIPTRYRTGRGYIYSSKFASDDEIKKELEDVYGCGIEHVRTIKFKTFRLKNVMCGNVVSIGLSSSFFEPLQATSIHNTIVQVRKFIELTLGETVEETLNPVTVADYNKTIENLFEGTANLIAMHYECGREDTKFWRFVKKEKDKIARVNSILKLVDIRLSRNDDFDKFFGSSGYVLWNNVMAGMGYFKKEVIERQFKIWGVDVESIVDQLQNIKSNLLKTSYENNFLTQDQLNEYLSIQKHLIIKG